MAKFNQREKINLPVGAAIYAERERLGMSQAELAKRTGRDLATVSRHENEEHSPSIEMLAVYGEALGCSASGLLAIAEQMLKSTPI